MKRRDFVRNVSVLGATAGLVRVAKPWAMASFLMDESDRSPGRDPMTILRSTLVVDGCNGGPMNEAYLKKLKAAGVNCRIAGGSIEFPDEIVLTTTVREIQQSYKQGKIAQIYHGHYADFLGNEHNQPMGDPRPPVAEFYEQGLRICGICYNVVNIYGGGCLEPHVGLTLAGRRLVEEIHKLRVVLDVGGHTGEKTSLDAIEMAPEIPVVDTHGNVLALNDNPRCNSDRMIEAIAKTGGVLGINSFSDFMVRNPKNDHLPSTPQATLDQYLDQFDYIRKLVGVDYVGLGTDNVIEGGVRVWEGMNRAVMTPESYSEVWTYPKDFESISELPNFVRGLIKRGWSTSEIRKVLGENWLRVYKQVWGV